LPLTTVALLHGMGHQLDGTVRTVSRGPTLLAASLRVAALAPPLRTHPNGEQELWIAQVSLRNPVARVF
jgi:hypothetical protein